MKAFNIMYGEEYLESYNTLTEAIKNVKILSKYNNSETTYDIELETSAFVEVIASYRKGKEV